MYEVPFGEDGGSGDLDKMRLALAKQNKPAPTPPSAASQIPGYGKPVPPAQVKPDPLGAAAGNFTELATKFNPLMMMKSMQESVRTLNPAIPVAGAWADVAQNIQTAGAEAIYDILGNPQGIAKMQQNYVPVTTGRFYQAPTTPVGKEFETDVIKAMDASKMPAMWPMALNQPIRPPITPNDVRVMGAEATRIGRQVKDIPTDFYNAQSGLQKLDPITGQPTVGSRFGQAERNVTQAGMQFEKSLDPIVQDIMAKGGTSADILATMSGQPLYAMRPAGSRVTSATLPATAKADAATYAPAQEIINNVIGEPTITPVQALDEIQNNILRKPEAASARRAFESFLKAKANEMYPDAPSEGAALAAYKAKFSDREASAAHSLEMYDEFLNTPNGIQYRAALNLPSAEELPARHEAAANWLNSQFTNYILEKVGTPNEPGAKLASQGLTFYPPADVFALANATGSSIEAKRTAAGMPAKTPTDEAVIAADQQLLELVQQAADAATRKRDQETIAKQLGYGAVDPNTGVVPEGMNLGRYEPFAQASRESDKANAAYRKQQKAIDNLRLGTAYEYAIDTAISADTAKGLKEDLQYGERQFYPSLMRTPDEERVYTASVGRLKDLGFGDLANSFYNDVMSGKIPLNKVPKMTVEKYIRDTAEGRIAEEKLAQAKEKQFKTDADNQFARSASLYIPNDKVFGNVGALEITNRFTPEQVAQLVSEDTLALDVCIGEGGNVRDKPNPWHPGTGNRQYIPIYNIVTGQRDPDATSPRGTYINAVENGSQMVSFRDVVTGEPVAIFDFNPSSSGKYDINFASGRKNGEVKPEYVQGIKSYLNSREDTIRGVSDKMNENLGIYDSKRMSNSALASVVNTPVTTFKKYDLSGLPRFVTSSDIRSYVEELKANAPQESAPAVLSQRPSESLSASTAGAVASAIDNILDSQRRAFDEAGESNQFVQAEAFFSGIRDYFDAYQNSQGPVRALELTNQRLYDLESEYANSPRIIANIIAEGMIDLMQTLGLQAEYVAARVAAEEAAQPFAFEQRGDPMPDLDTPELLAAYRDRLSPAQVDWLQDFARRFENERSPVAVDNLIEEFARWRATNRLLPEGQIDYLRMTHDAALAADRQWGVQTADEVRVALRFITEGQGAIDGPLDPANDTDAYIRALRQQADAAVQGSAEIVLNELADAMESAYMRDWEPADEQPPARRQTTPMFDFAGTVDTMADELGANLGDAIGNQFTTVANGIAAHTNPRLDPVGYATALRRWTHVNGDDPVTRELNILADAVEVSAQPAAPQAPADLEQIRDRLSDQVSQIYSELNRDRLAGLTPLIDSILTPLNNSYVFNDRFLAAPAERLQALLSELGNQIDTLETRGEYERAAASRLSDYHNVIEYALRDLQQPAPVVQPAQPAPAPPPAVTLSRNIDPATATFINDYIANARTVLDEDVVASVLRKINATAAYADARNDPAGFAVGLELAADDAMSPIVETALRELADHFAHRAPPSAADLANQRNERMIEAEDALNDPELNPEDLNSVARAMEGNINPYWNALDADERRVLAQRFRQRANYAEFNPADFAAQLINDVDSNLSDLRDTVQALYNTEFDHEVLRGLPDYEVGRAAHLTAVALERLLPTLEAAQGQGAVAQQPPVDVTPAVRNDAYDIATTLDDAYYQGADSPQQALAMVDYHLSLLRDSPTAAFDAILNRDVRTLAVGDTFTYSPALIQALITELELIYTTYRDRIVGGNANGGPVRGYQKGGSVKKPDVPTPYLFSVPTYSETVAYEMYPGQLGQNDQRDAARHMLAAGTLSRKYGPKTAEFLGKAHEFTTSPLQSVKSMFTGKMPADYDMDTHNNRFGAQLGQRAKSQAELEDLVQAEAERASRTQTPDKAFIKKANGGIVQENPTTDQMRYALTMRRK